MLSGHACVSEITELEDIAKREPWHDDNADWKRRVESLRIAKQLELMTLDIGQAAVPYYSYEEAEQQLREMIDMPDTHRESSREKLQDFYIKELQESISRISGFLFGSSGEGGAIRRIEDSQKIIIDEIRLDREDRHRVDEEHAKELTTLATRIGKAEHDINSLADKMRGGETWKRAAINGGVFLVLSGIGAVLALGIRAYMAGS